MRIATGKLKGRRLARPAASRPTSDKVRQAIFNILGAVVEGAEALELFAGSGAVGLEAWSRGARRVTFVEADHAALAALRRNIATGPGEAQAELLIQDAFAAVRRLQRAGRRFDLIFLDPPYRRGWAKKCLLAVEACGILRPAGWLVAEHEEHEEMPEAAGALQRRSVHRYGHTRVSCYQAR
ncbi:MAG: 16S rRNA (guanine(966)-N(2))-methyltransferase RsmD [Candidatus Omnitrophica bacterium]|nr:16S rRNA (guanine(966)-N(2))-methyltransferase RsmD [Candidatus Omnitrophota bacterium]